MAQRIDSNVVDFRKYLERTENGNGVFPPSYFTDEVIDYFYGDQKHQGAALPWEKAAGTVRFRKAEVTVWTGMNGHGKSMALGQMALGFHAQGQKTCLASFEMRPHVTLARMWRQAAMSDRPSEERIRLLHKKTDDTLLLYDQQGTVKAETVLAVMRYCAEERGCGQFVLDSFMKCGIGEDDFNRQKWFLDQICTVARDTGMHIHVVTHSRKHDNEESPPGKMDVKGTGTITDQADNVIVFYRNKRKEKQLAYGNEVDDEKDADFLLICDKQRNGEWQGILKLWFDRRSLQFCPTHERVPRDFMGIAPVFTPDGYVAQDDAWGAF
jgi:twinkle protein